MFKTDSKRITVFINKLNSGGAEKVCVLLCNELVQRGYTVELWVINHEKTVLAEKLDKSVRTVNFGKQSVRNGFFRLAQELIKAKPKTLLIFNTELCILAILIKLSLFLKTKIIFRSINTLSMELNGSLSYYKRYIVYPLVKTFLNSTSYIIAQSEGMKEDLIANYNIDKNKIETIPNPAVILKSIASDEIVDTKTNEFVFIGRLVHQKGLELLFKALSIALKSVNDIQLTIIGEGEESEKLVQLAEELNLSKHITFVGFCDNVSAYILRSKATLLTSYFEGFPNVLVESISLGTPVVSFDCPSGPRDIIESNVNGILVPYLNVELFAEALVQIVNDDLKLDKNKIIESSKKFSLKLVVDKYENLLANCANF